VDCLALRLSDALPGRSWELAVVARPSSTGDFSRYGKSPCSSLIAVAVLQSLGIVVKGCNCLEGKNWTRRSWAFCSQSLLWTLQPQRPYPQPDAPDFLDDVEIYAAARRRYGWMAQKVGSSMNLGRYHECYL
jgi:hypothetical protein